MPVPSPAARSVVRSVALSVDVVLFTPRRNELAVLLLSTAPSRGRGRAILPTDALRADESLDDAASRVARSALGATPAFLEQVGALGGTRRQADMAQVAVLEQGIDGVMRQSVVGGQMPEAEGQRRLAAQRGGEQHGEQHEHGAEDGGQGNAVWYDCRQ